MVQQSSFRARFLHPVLVLFVVMASSWLVYNASWRFDSPLLHQALASVSGTILFLSVAFGALLVYSLAYSRGASLHERIIAALANPFFWATKECARLYVSHSFAECVYYYFNPLNLWLLLGVIAQMGLAEMLCRRRLAKRGEPIQVVVPGAAAALGGGLFLVIALFAWGQGEGAYVVFLEGYRALFGSGL